jgi:hypothetical protein
MKKFLLILFMMPTFTTFAGKDKAYTKTNHDSKNAMICFGWTTIYSSTTGKPIGKYSYNCWNASQGWHYASVLYEY